jgi:two-component system phosphate regulon sensor histidine kinase PhoR
LRTPLTVIHGYLELLDPEDVPELAPVLGEMRAQSKRMGQIVEDLLTLSRLETQHEVVDERVPMAALLATVRKEAEALSQGRHRIVLESTAGADLLGSPKDLHSALSNLASNAVRYTPTGGSITIRWQREPAGAVYSVSDTGFGIPAAHLARLTERFYRVSSSRSRDSGGTGLGLSIVKHVLNLHQARLRIESTPGAGSTFACHFGGARLLAPGDNDEG